jgi:predicted Fe-Mo cluster-binding NifX family protein
MKIAISAERAALDAPLDQRFGRCCVFVIVETDDLSFTAVDNASAAQGGGAGIQAARLVADNGAKAVLTGSCGPNAHQTLSAAGVEIYLGCSGMVADAVAQFRAEKLRPSSSPNAPSHAGMGTGSGGER